MNKILYPPLIFIGSSIPIYIFALIDRSVDSIVTVCIWSLLLLFILWKSMDNFWINRRLPVMCPNNYKSVKVVGNNSEQKIDVCDEENDIHYRYDAKNKKFIICRVMHTNPLRYLKEYEERKYQFRVRLEQLRIPMDAYMSDIKSDYSYGTFVRLTKKCASPENIKLVRQTLIDLAKDDYFKRSDIKQIVAAKDVCVAFYDELSDTLYYVHYVENKAIEILAENAESHEIDCLDYDELDENYQHLEDLSKMLGSGEVAFVGTIPIENLKSKNEIYLDN